MKNSMRDVTDRLSDLPDNLLLRIIELLNTKQSFQMCVLSKRWKNLWKHFINLILQHCNMDTTDSDVFCKFVSHILSGRDHSIPLHSLSFKHDDIQANSSKTTLLDVMGYAASHNVQQLSVIALLNHMGDPELPYSIFNCSSLTFLRLGFCQECRSNRTMFPKSLNMPSLKTLHLQYLTFTTSDNGLAEPFSACNMLNTLVIMRCYLQDDAQALCISNSKVSSLTINTNHHILEWEESHYYEVVFCTPKLTSLTTTGHPTFKAPSAENLLFLEEIKIDYCYHIAPGEYQLMSSFFKLFVNVKIMTLCFDALEYIELTLREMARKGTQPPCFVGLKSLKVDLTKNDRNASNMKVSKLAKFVLQNSPAARVYIIRPV